MTAVDHEEDGSENLRPKTGIELMSIFTRKSLLELGKR